MIAQQVLPAHCGSNFWAPTAMTSPPPRTMISHAAVLLQGDGGLTNHVSGGCHATDPSVRPGLGASPRASWAWRGRDRPRAATSIRHQAGCGASCMRLCVSSPTSRRSRHPAPGLFPTASGGTAGPNSHAILPSLGSVLNGLTDALLHRRGVPPADPHGTHGSTPVPSAFIAGDRVPRCQKPATQAAITTEFPCFSPNAPIGIGVSAVRASRRCWKGMGVRVLAVAGSDVRLPTRRTAS